jgi:hypothetical protein
MRRRVCIEQQMTVKQLAAKLQIKESVVIKCLFEHGFMRTVNQIVELSLARQCALDLGYKLGDKDEDLPGDDYGAPVPKNPKHPEGGTEVSLQEPTSQD